jgi:hypothetical protein
MIDSTCPWAVIFINTFVSGVSSWGGDLARVYELALDQGYFVRHFFILDASHRDCFERMLDAARDDRIVAVFTPAIADIDGYTGRRTGLVTQVADVIALYPPRVVPKVAS